MTTGTPLYSLAHTLGASFSCAMPVIMRPAPKMSELMADSAAVMSTKFRTPATPVDQSWFKEEKICVKGDSSPLTVRHGLMQRMTKIAST